MLLGNFKDIFNSTSSIPAPISAGGGARKDTPSLGVSSLPTSVADDRAWASEEAEKQRAWSKSMSDTAYQRAIEDLKKAGLNPALAYQQGGASVGTGAMASTAATYQQSDIARENNLFKTLNTALTVLGNLASTAIRIK